MADQISNAVAANLYANTAKAGSSVGMDAPKGPSFGDLVKAGLQQSVDTVRAGEQASARAVTGDANLQDVVGAITQAELTLETVVAVRDRLVSAYQEIMRMPI
ncbi:MAG: flagellar hook-basal body complex protein FliE [Pseudomonadota bacterium]